MRLSITQSNLPAVQAIPNVLHVRVVAGAGGGPEKTILRSARYTDPQRLNVAAAYIHPHVDPDFESVRRQAREQSCTLHEVAESGPMDPRTFTSMLRLCRQLNVTAWHGHDYKSNLMGLMLRPFHPMRLITTVHGWTNETPRTRLYRRVDEFCLPRYERVIAVSPLLEKRCLELGVSRDRLVYLPNGIECNIYRRRRTVDEARVMLGLSRDARILGVVGRLSREKGVDRVVRAFAGIRAAVPSAQLHLIGDGAERSAVEQLARELDVADAVRIWGWRPDTRPLFEAMNMLVLPSRTEGLPNAVLEAMAMETAVAATDVGGVRELLADGKCGMILENDEAQWAARIAPVLRDDAALGAYARLARQRAESRYTFEARMIGEMRVYESVLDIPEATRIAERLAA